MKVKDLKYIIEHSACIDELEKYNENLSVDMTTDGHLLIYSKPNDVGNKRRAPRKITNLKERFGNRFIFNVSYGDEVYNNTFFEISMPHWVDEYRIKKELEMLIGRNLYRASSDCLYCHGHFTIKDGVLYEEY